MEASCDVEGCESRVPLASGGGAVFPGGFAVPDNWYIVLVPPSDIEVSRRRKEIQDEFGDEVSRIPLPLRGGGFSFPEKYIIYDRHELPKLRRR